MALETTSARIVRSLRDTESPVAAMDVRVPVEAYGAWAYTIGHEHTATVSASAVKCSEHDRPAVILICRDEAEQADLLRRLAAR